MTKRELILKMLEENAPFINWRDPKPKPVHYVIWGILVFIWIAGIFYFQAQIDEDQRALDALHLQQQQKEERLRRAAAYDRARTEQAVSTGTVKNAVDLLNKR